MICSGCRSPVYKCSKCGATGCEKEGCTGQNFKSGKCERCGNYIKTAVR